MWFLQELYLCIHQVVCTLVEFIIFQGCSSSLPYFSPLRQLFPDYLKVSVSLLWMTTQTNQPTHIMFFIVVLHHLYYFYSQIFFLHILIVFASYHYFSNSPTRPYAVFGCEIFIFIFLSFRFCFTCSCCPLHPLKNCIYIFQLWC